MAICDTCDLEMLSADGCIGLSSSNDAPFIRYGDETRPLSRGARCRDCNVKRGQLHHPGCAMEECSRCHHQRFLCGNVDCDEVRGWATGGTAA